MPKIRTTGVRASYCKIHELPPPSGPEPGPDVSVNITGRPMRGNICMHSIWNRR
jgi:hypothetical protein